MNQQKPALYVEIHDGGDQQARRPPLLLIHGWGGRGAVWDPLVRAWAPRHRVVVPDLRGHGRSPATDEGYDPRLLAGDLAGVLVSSDAAPAVVVGHSWGAQVAVALAVERPQLVRAVVAVDPAFGGRDDAWPTYDALRGWGARRMLDEFVASAFVDATPQSLRRQVVDDFAGTSLAVLAEAFAGMYLTSTSFGRQPDTERYLSGLTQPLLGLFSTVWHEEWARGLALPEGSAIRLWTGVGHYLHLERPAEFVALVDTWLEAIAASVPQSAPAARR